MKVLTFVIPAYNSEIYLDKCISSMLAKDVLDKLEILVVNDGSTDSTPEIAEKYCAMYPETVRLISQTNRGHGGALNTGCSAAQGKYLKVIDADDWIETQALPLFIEKLESCGGDVVLTHHRTIDIQTGETKNWRSFPDQFDVPYTLEQIMEDWPSFERSMAFHGITYRTAFYREHGAALPENVFYEDHEFAAFPCCHGAAVVPMDIFIYQYRIGDGNQSVAQSNQLKRMDHSQTVFEHMTERYRRLPEHAGKAYAAEKLRGLLMSYLTTALLVEPDRKKGRFLAENQMEFCRREAPAVYDRSKRKYQTLRMMNRLHIDKAMFDRLLASRLYGIARKKRDFY